MSPAWLPVRCGRQCQAIVVNQASARENSGWEHSMQTLWEVCEVVETQVDVCYIEETLYRGSNRCTIKGKDTRFKCCWSRNDKGTDGLGVFVVKEWIGKVSEAQRVPDRIILVKLIVGQHVDTILCVNAPQSGLVMRLKTCSLISWVLWLPGIPGFEFLIPWGVWNGHVGRAGTG